MIRYRYAPSKIFSGVRIKTRICLQNSAVTTANAMEIPAASAIAFTTYRRIREYSFAPKVCATGIANPLHSPMQKPRIRKFREPLAPTDASASIPSVFPTIIESARL